MDKKSKTKNTVPIVTLTTDFGLSDGYVGVVKGVILGIARNAQIVDLTHDIPAWDIAAAAWNIQAAYKFFPSDAIHLVVIDPAVGSGNQQGLVLYGEGGIFVGPDNGVLSKLLEDDYDWKARVLNQSGYWLATVSNTFHARDIYGSVCGHLAAGVSPTEIGEPVALADLKKLPATHFHSQKNEVEGEIVYVDRFGNLITNIPGSFVDRISTCQVNGKACATIGKTYSTAAVGAPCVFCGSHGFVEIGVFQGRASQHFGVERGGRVRLELKS